MAPFLGDINARARGLRTHLLPLSELEKLAHAPNLLALQRELSAHGFARQDAPATATVLEQGIRRHAAAQIALLNRWSAGPRRRVLAVLFEDEDQRSIQAILRGAEQGASAASRLAGLVPTENLPERALHSLAAQPTIKEVVHLLGWLRHPLAVSLLEPASRPHPSLFQIEVALHRAFATRAQKNARDGDPNLRAYAAQLIDIMNAWSVLLHFDERDPSIADLVFVDGGSSLPRIEFQRLLNLRGVRDAGDALTNLFRGSPLSGAFRHSVGNPPALESAILRAQIDWQNRSLRTDPGGTAPIIGFALELRAQAIGLRRIVWGVALQAPPPLLFPGLEVA